PSSTTIVWSTPVAIAAQSQVGEMHSDSLEFRELILQGAPSAPLLEQKRSPRVLGRSGSLFPSRRQVPARLRFQAALAALNSLAARLLPQILPSAIDRTLAHPPGRSPNLKHRIAGMHAAPEGRERGLKLAPRYHSPRCARLGLHPVSSYLR